MIDLNHSKAVDFTVRKILMQRLAVAGCSDLQLGEGTDLLDLGILDSEDLVEVILEVEEQCECEFNPMKIDLESGLTLSGFISAFVARR